MQLYIIIHINTSRTIILWTIQCSWTRVSAFATTQDHSVRVDQIFDGLGQHVGVAFPAEVFGSVPLAQRLLQRVHPDATAAARPPDHGVRDERHQIVEFPFHVRHAVYTRMGKR